jgi:WD40 repeat protein
MLAKRLSRCGLAISGGALSLALSQGFACASVPTSTVASTIKATGLFGSGSTASKALIPLKVIALAEGVMKAMIVTKAKMIAATLLLVLVGLGGVVQLSQSSAIQPGVKENFAHQATALQEQPSSLPTWHVGPVLTGHGGQVRRVAFSPDGKYIASGSRDKSVVIWDASKRTSLHTLSCEGEVWALAFAPIGKILVTARGNDEHVIKFWNPESGKEQAALKKSTHPIHSLAFSHDGKMLISTSCPIDLTKPVGENRGEVSFWDYGTKRKLATLKSDLVHNAAVSHDRKKLVILGSGPGGTVQYMQIDGEFAIKAEAALNQDQVCCLAVSADGKSFATTPVSSDDLSICLWDFETGALVKTFEHKDTLIRCVAFAPDGKTFATGSWKIHRV